MTMVYEWPPVADHMRSSAENIEFNDLLRQHDRGVARMAELGVDIRRLRPDPVRQAARDLLTVWRTKFIGQDDESDLEAVVEALTELEEALDGRPQRSQAG